MLFKNLLFRRSTPQIIEFSPSQKAELLEVMPDTNPAEALMGFHLSAYNAVIGIHSGAGNMSEADVTKVNHLIAEGLVKFAYDHQALIIDGATASGTARVMGEARRALHASFPLLGVSVSGSIAYPGGPAPDDTHFALEENHSHFLIVRGTDFGAESELIVNLIGIWGIPQVAVIINGGKIVEKEAKMHARRGTPLLVLKGSGRFADELAESRPGDATRADYPGDTQIIVFDITQSPEELYTCLVKVLRR